MARDAPYAVVFRRGPSKEVCTVGWNRAADEFSVGQWLKGRIYERRADLSPDGKHLIYFASNGKQSWTAISRAPYLKAIGLWTKGDCWNGGGLFRSNHEFWLNERCPNEELKPPLACVETSILVGESLSVYYPRLHRDGWTLKREEKRPGGDDVSIFEKRGHAGWTLRKVCHATTNHPPGKGCYWDEHELEDFNAVQSKPDWEWADFDGRRIVGAEHGRLFAAQITAKGLDEQRELFDFNPLRFEAIKAPY
jgi:hypothetical protein